MKYRTLNFCTKHLPNLHTISHLHLPNKQESLGGKNNISSLMLNKQRFHPNEIRWDRVDGSRLNLNLVENRKLGARKNRWQTSNSPPHLELYGGKTKVKTMKIQKNQKMVFLLLLEENLCRAHSLRFRVRGTEY